MRSARAGTGDQPFAELPQSRKFHAPLQPGNSAPVTVSCRHTNPDICKKNGMPQLCALVRRDEMCHAPPASWAKQYIALLRQRANET